MEIAKSITLKVNIGNFQSVDLFCSVKSEATEKNQDEVAERLHQFCVAEITKDRNTSLKYLANLVSEEEKKKILQSEI